MIPWNKFNTPQDAYDWAKKYMSVADKGYGLWFRLAAPSWSQYWWVIDQLGRTFVQLPRVRR